MHRLRTLLAALLLILIVPACDSSTDDDEEEVSIEGEWLAQDFDPSTGTAAEVQLFINENEGDLGGGASLLVSVDGQQVTFPGSLEGSYDYPSVEMDLEFSNPLDANETLRADFDGEISEGGELMDGTITSSGSPDAIRFVRQ